MLAPAGRELADFAGYRASYGSPALAALTTALTRLAEVADLVTAAVQRHDRAALEDCNARSEVLVAEVGKLTGSLTAEDRTLLEESGVTALGERLAAAARRNAYLIEQAWAVDAALMRLLVGVGKSSAEGAAGAYGTPPAPAYVDREA